MEGLYVCIPESVSFPQISCVKSVAGLRDWQQKVEKYPAVLQRQPVSCGCGRCCAIGGHGFLFATQAKPRPLSQESNVVLFLKPLFKFVFSLLPYVMFSPLSILNVGEFAPCTSICTIE